MSDYFFLFTNKTDIVYNNKFIEFIAVLKSLVIKKFKTTMEHSENLDEMHNWISEYVKNNKDNLTCSDKDKSILCNKPNLFVINFCLLVNDLNKYNKFEEIDLIEIKNNSKITCANYIKDCSNNTFEDNTFYNNESNENKMRCACGKMVIPQNITYIKKNDIKIQFGDVCMEKTGIITKKEIKKVKLKYEKRNNLIQKWAIITNNLIKYNKSIIINIVMKQISEYRICIECLELKVPKNKPHWNKACLDCYYKKTQVPLNKCLISIKR
jgi:hypothetical protein